MCLPDESAEFSGRRPFARRVFVKDPLGLSLIGGYGLLIFVDYRRGVPVQAHVDLGHNRTAHVPPEWLADPPDDATNVVAFCPRNRAPLRLGNWSAA